MPTDLTTNHSARIIQVRDRAGTGLPFSKGLMATSILATGVRTEVAYRIAADIERHLRENDQYDLDAEELVRLATEMIERHTGAAVPIVIAHGGTRSDRDGRCSSR